MGLVKCLCLESRLMIRSLKHFNITKDGEFRHLWFKDVLQIVELESSKELQTVPKHASQIACRSAFLVDIRLILVFYQSVQLVVNELNQPYHFGCDAPPGLARENAGTRSEGLARHLRSDLTQLAGQRWTESAWEPTKCWKQKYEYKKDQESTVLETHHGNLECDISMWKEGWHVQQSSMSPKWPKWCCLKTVVHLGYESL